MERKKYGFTMIELLTVIGIIALLVGLLIPALNMVNTMAKEAKQKAQITAIELALTAFRNDYGDYPPSSWDRPPVGKGDYCGAQKLAEALLGWDLMGFHPKSEWTSNGWDKATGTNYWIYPPPPLDQSNLSHRTNLEERRGPYLELGSANAYRVGSTPGMKDGLFNDPVPLAPNPYVICDAFGVKRITLNLPNNQTERFLAGTPILYYRANTISLYKSIDRTLGTQDLIYNVYDNLPFISTQQFPKLPPLKKGVLWHKLGVATGTYENFYEYIRDPKVTTTPWPYRPDSYILISAGADGEYGTADDITNF